MRIEQTSTDVLGRMNQTQGAKKHNAGDFASVLSSVQSDQTEKAAEKESNPRNPLGIPDEEYRWYFIGLRYDADHVAYFPPHDAPVEQQRAWYEAVKGLSHLEMQLFMTDLSSALRGEKDYLSYDEMTEKSKSSAITVYWKRSINGRNRWNMTVPVLSMSKALRSSNAMSACVRIFSMNGSKERRRISEAGILTWERLRLGNTMKGRGRQSLHFFLDNFDMFC